MDKGIRAARDQVAMERIVAATAILADRLKLDVVGIPIAGRNREVLAMQQREAVADLLEAVVNATKPKRASDAKDK